MSNSYTKNGGAAKSLPAFVAGYLRLQAKDVGLLALAVLGTTAAFGLMFCVICHFVGQDAWEVAVLAPGILAVLVAAVCQLVNGIVRVNLDFVLGLGMGATRRRMLVCLLVHLLLGAVLLAEAALLDRLWGYLLAPALLGAGPGSLLAQMPLWAWVVLALAPAAVGAAGSALVLRFGRWVGWALYAVFMLGCAGSSQWVEAAVDWVAAWPPQAGAVAAALALAATAGMAALAAALLGKASLTH